MTHMDMHTHAIARARTRFQLVDEQGAGEPFAGLAYEVVNSEGQVTLGNLDATGCGAIDSPFGGPVVVRFTRLQGGLQITELQFRAEHTRYANKNGARTRNNPAKKSVDTDYYQIEVRHLVEHVSHLPPLVDCHYPLNTPTQHCMQARGQFGLGLAVGRFTVLQVRPLRALSPMLCAAAPLSALNRYQMALMAAADDCPFAQPQDRAVHRAYRPLYEDVAYSKRLQVAPVSTAQVLIAHNDDVLLIALRGTRKAADFMRDTDMRQVPFTEGEGCVHHGFYEAAKHVYDCVGAYLNKCCVSQKVLVCGHGLNGAVALILSQMLRIRRHIADLQLYTYGAPRAADAAFVQAAESLLHERMVNHHDPLPSGPSRWMNTPLSTDGAQPMLGFINVPPELGVFVAGLSQLRGELYQHHGTLCHFMPIDRGQGQVSQVMWAPTSDIVTQHALSRAVFEQAQEALISVDHSVGVDSYLANCWVALRRTQEALEMRRSLVTEPELRFIDQAFESIAQQLRVEYQRVMTWPDKDIQAQERSINLLMRELCRLHITRKRLCSLRFKVPSATDVYGEYAKQPQVLAQSLERWLEGDVRVCSEPWVVASAS